jgi:Flp pilus assembly protein TadD
MRMRTLIAIAIAFVICIGASAIWSAETTSVEGDTDANIIATNGSPTGASVEKKKGNSVARFISAPFRAMGRLFGRGKDDGRPQRLSEKDVAKFESVGASRIDDARSEKKTELTSSSDAREHLAAGRALLQRGRTNEAIAELSYATSLDGDLSEALNLLGIAYDKKGMPENARNAYERAVKANPHDAQLLNNLGFSLYQNGNYRAAVDKLKKAAKISPSDERVLNNLALAQARLGKYEDAYKTFARAGGEFTGNLNTATMLERAGLNDEAIKYYEAARKIQPNSSIALRRLADLYQRAGRSDDAQQTRRAMDELASKMAVAKG